MQSELHIALSWPTSQHEPDGAAACRGAHTFFLRQGQVARWGGYTVNLIHYEDAASLCVAVSF